MVLGVEGFKPLAWGQRPCSLFFQFMVSTYLQRFSQLLGTGGVGATPPRRGFTPAPRIQTARKVL